MLLDHLPACRSERTVAGPAAVLAGDGTAPAFGSSGVQKAVLLARYTDLLQGW